MMDIDWSRAPEGVTHAIDDGLGYVRWRRITDSDVHHWDEQSRMWRVLGDFRSLSKEFDYISKPDVTSEANNMTVERLVKLSKESGFEIDIHPDGKLYVWDDEMDAHATGTVDEIIELCEAKKEWLKVWTKFHWD